MINTKEEEPIFQAEAEILANREMGPGLYWIDLKCPKIAAAARPGHFVHLVVSDVSSRSLQPAWLRHTPLLRRPFSIAERDVDAGTIGLIYRVLGGGTEILSQRAVGQTIDVLGPMGRTFEPIAGGRPTCIVAGGVGIAPFFFLVKEGLSAGDVEPDDVAVFFGASTGTLLSGEEKLRNMGVTIQLATDDGSRGHKGFVSELLTRALQEKPESCAYIYACGPTPMMRGVQDIARDWSRPGQVSLEGIMPCGVGVCMACVVACRSKDDEGTRYERVCHSGPVFDIQEVVL